MLILILNKTKDKFLPSIVFGSDKVSRDKDVVCTLGYE